MQLLVRRYRECPELGWTPRAEILDQPHPAVLAHRSTWDDGSLIALHNLGTEPAMVPLRLRRLRRHRPAGRPAPGRLVHHRRPRPHGGRARRLRLPLAPRGPRERPPPPLTTADGGRRVRPGPDQAMAAASTLRAALMAGSIGVGRPSHGSGDPTAMAGSPSANPTWVPRRPCAALMSGSSGQPAAQVSVGEPAPAGVDAMKPNAVRPPAGDRAVPGDVAGREGGAAAGDRRVPRLAQRDAVRAGRA